MAKPRKPIKDEKLKNWLMEFESKNTQSSYLTALRKFREVNNIESLDSYKPEDATEHVKNFIFSMNGRPSKSIATMLNAVRVYLTDHKIPFDNNELKRLRRRGKLPKRMRAETNDEILTKAQFRKVLDYLDIRGKALFLFLVSSGCRIGEALRINPKDLDLEADPPSCYVRGETTKGGYGARTVFMSYEARDSINNWLAVKDGMKKTTGQHYRKDLVFDWTEANSRYMFTEAIKKAGLGERDHKTKRFIYHIHGLRKFFTTNIKLSENMTHALLGHVGYLDNSYVRFTKKQLGEAYLKNMVNVSIYDSGNVIDIKEFEEMKRELARLRRFRNLMEKAMKKYNNGRIDFSVFEKENT
jgi:integrase